VDEKPLTPFGAARLRRLRLRGRSISIDDKLMRRAATIVLAAIPIVMLTFAIPFVNRLEPRILGLPFLMAWILAWVLLTPVFLYSISRIQGDR